MTSVNSTNRAIRGQLLVVLGFEAALVALLHWTASPTYTIPLGSLVDWFQSSDPAVALVAVARLAALAIGYWLLTTTVLYALAHQLGWQAMTETLRWITLPVVRRVVQGVTAVSLTGFSIVGPAAISVGPALAQEDAVVAQEVDDPNSSTSNEESPSTEYQPDAAGWPQVEVDGDFWRPSGVNVTTQAATTHTVAGGDHLWSIAADHLRTATGRDVTEDEICQYWIRVVEANHHSIQSGDPDMIYPSEQITLPQVFSE